MRRIKNRGKLKKEGLIISILKSEGSNAERSYMKHFNINANVKNNTNVSNNNDANNNANDDGIRGKKSNIRTIIRRLGNTITKNDRKKIKKQLHEKENKKNLSDEKEEKIYDDLVELLRALDKKIYINIMTVMI